MLDNLKLNLPECENIDLQSLNIDWDNFNLACVKYYNRWCHITSTLNVKTYKPTSDIIQQINNFYTGYTFYVDSDDVLYQILQIAEQLHIDDAHMPPESHYNWYNSDIVGEFEIIPQTINTIESHIGIEFGHIKLRHVGPKNVETIHTDYGDCRYHIPIVTNDAVFFVSNDKIFHMRNSNKLYILDTTTPHTIVNASGALGRLHLIATDKSTDYTFTSENLHVAAAKYVELAETLLQNIKPHERELNNAVYKKVKLALLKLKKLNKK